jgi:hypothetical protein
VILAHAHGIRFTETGPQYVWSGNWAALAGVLICFCLLILWVERDTIELRRKNREWDE